MEPRDTILVVDDTADIADLLRDLLTGAGYRVLVARSVDIGLKILAAFRIGLVLTDAPQPAAADRDDAAPVWAELDRLALAARKTPLVLYAGAHPERYAEYAAHGIAACLAKPLDLDAVVALVGTLLPDDGHRPAVAHGSATAIKG
jgi:DNA-binding response OmpR family regulator